MACAQKWTTTAPRKTEHICGEPKGHAGSHICSVCGVKK